MKIDLSSLETRLSFSSTKSVRETETTQVSPTFLFQSTLRFSENHPLRFIIQTLGVLDLRLVDRPPRVSDSVKEEHRRLQGASVRKRPVGIYFIVCRDGGQGEKKCDEKQGSNGRQT